MKKATKIWLIVAVFLVIVGLVLFAMVLREYSWDFTKLSTKKYETNTYEVTKDFNNLTINTNTADISFALSNNGKCTVECFEEETSKHRIFVEGDTLVIKAEENKAWYDYIGFSFGSPKITVYLPKAEYNVLLIKEHTGNIAISESFRFKNADITASTGDIRIENASADTLTLRVSTGAIHVSDATCTGDVTIQVSTGKAYLTNIHCKNLLSDGDTGDLFLKNVIATERISIERDTGDVRFDNSDAVTIFVETDTGDITGTLLTEKTFIAEADTGRVEVPKSTTGGKCELETDTGDIKITVKNH